MAPQCTFQNAKLNKTPKVRFHYKQNESQNRSSSSYYQDHPLLLPKEKVKDADKKRILTGVHSLRQGGRLRKRMARLKL